MKPYVVWFLLLVFSSSSLALDIAKAYRLIPHQQTPFYLSKTNIPNAEAKYVSRLLTLSELAMVERIEAMTKGVRKSRYHADIKEILSRLANLNTPSKLVPAHQHIVTAIEQHRSYFDMNTAKSKKQQLVQSSHQHLIAAYNVLMQLYPQETKHNKKAFFDYLCALDFI